MEASAFDSRIRLLEKKVIVLAWLCGVLMIALTLVLRKPPLHEVKAAESPSVLHLKGLVIEDEQGRARVLLGAPFPNTHERLRQDAMTTTMVFLDEQGHDRFSIGEFMPAQINGKIPSKFHRMGSSTAYGLTIFDTAGNERGGMGFLSNGSTVNRATIALDRPGADAIGLMVDDETGMAGLVAMYPQEVGDHSTGLLLATQGSKAFFTMKDARDIPRATFEIGPELSPSFRLFDKGGKGGPEMLKTAAGDDTN